MVVGRVGAGWLGWFAAVGAACSPPDVDDPGGSTSTGGSSGSTDVGSTIPDVMTTTETPDESSGSTDAPPLPSCDDLLKNQDESDVDCGGGCSPCLEGQTCNSGTDCTTMACLAGVCTASACLVDADCTALDSPCSQGLCDLQSFLCKSTPIHEGEACDDETLCTTASSCAAGSCIATETVDCSGFDSACTQGQCDPNSGACLAIDTLNGTACDDGDSCTAEEFCKDGSCVTAEAGALFFEDFTNPAPGWELDKLWELGPAVSSPAAVGGVDPADDHSPGDDRGLAGTGIGTLDTASSHEPWCLTSPSVDTTAAGANLWVSFWRHLHTPAKPKVIHTVDVWTGAVWQNLETGYDKTINDADWTFVKFDASGTKSKEFRVRICVERIQGAADYAGWSIDDLTIASVACTPG